MKLDMKFCGWVIGAAWTFASIAQAYGNEISIKSIRHYVNSNFIAADPSVMVLVGVALIALRVLMARRSKRREKNAAHS